MAILAHLESSEYNGCLKSKQFRPIPVYLMKILTAEREKKVHIFSMRLLARVRGTGGCHGRNVYTRLREARVDFSLLR